MDIDSDDEEDDMAMSDVCNVNSNGLCYADAYEMLVNMTSVFNSLSLNKYVSSETHAKCLNSFRKLKADWSFRNETSKKIRIRVPLKINVFLRDVRWLDFL